MTQRTRNTLLVGSVLFLAAIGVIGLLLWSKEPQTVSRATSPDGTWSVEVLANPQLNGSSEIVVHFLDGQGNRLPGGFVIDLTRDLSAARTHHAVSFVDNKTAKVGNRTVEKPTALFD